MRPFQTGNWIKHIATGWAFACASVSCGTDTKSEDGACSAGDCFDSGTGGPDASGPGAGGAAGGAGGAVTSTGGAAGGSGGGTSAGGSSASGGATGGSTASGGASGSALDSGTTAPVRPPGCGDGACGASESCATCAIDCAPCGASTCTAGNCITVDDTVLHQTMGHWEATAQAGQSTPGFASYGDELIDRAANELGINRLRVEVKSPSVGADFDLSAVDRQMTDVAVPLRAALASRGESLWVNVCVVGNQLKDDPSKYASEALRTVEHIESTYGIVPDSWEVALEPDVFGWDDPILVGNALVAAGKLLMQSGYDLDFVAPSTTQAARVPSYVDAMAAIPDIFDHWRELSYHRYDYPDAAALQAIATRATQHGLRSSMLEHIDSGHVDLFADLTLANVSSWQQYTLAFPAATDDGAQYYWPTSNGTVLTLADRARYLQQYFAYVRPGAIRVEATSTRATLQPTAFVTPDNRYVVVMRTSGTLTMGIAGLPAGTYGVTYTTATDTHTAGPDITVTSGSAADLSIPGAGAITVFQK